MLDDGRRLTVDRLVLLGRNPRPAPGEEDAQLIKIADETRTVSKLHLAIGVDARRAVRRGPGLDQRLDGDHPGGRPSQRAGGTVYVSAGRSSRWVTIGWRSAADCDLLGQRLRMREAPRVLSVGRGPLDERSVQATFFRCGEWEAALARCAKRP